MGRGCQIKSREIGTLKMIEKEKMCQGDPWKRQLFTKKLQDKIKNGHLESFMGMDYEDQII